MGFYQSVHDLRMMIPAVDGLEKTNGVRVVAIQSQIFSNPQICLGCRPLRKRPIEAEKIKGTEGVDSNAVG